MKRYGTVICLTAIFSFMCLSAYSADNSKVPPKVKLAKHLQDISVTIKAYPYQGSGTTVVRGDTTYILTAGHVVEHLRKARKVVDPKTGSSKMLVEYDPVEIYTAYTEDGEGVGDRNMIADVITVSNADNGDDLALLKVKKKNYNANGAVFYKVTKSNLFPDVGTRLYHCGSLHGEFGHNSVVDGIVSRIGKVIDKKIYDQTNLNIFPGSSGGGVYDLETGEYCGMIVRGTLGGFNFMVPMRRIKSWAERVKVDWILDPDKTAPSAEDLAKLSVDDPLGLPTTQDAGGGFRPYKLATSSEVGFLVKDLRQKASSPLKDSKQTDSSFNLENSEKKN